MSLNGKRALVTGGSRGIGRAIALKLASEGAEVVINYLRNDLSAKETVESIRAEGGIAHSIKANVGSLDSVKALFAEIRTKFLPLDILVHSAALGTFKPLTQLTGASWDLTLSVNTKALFLCAKEFAALEGSGGERVIIGISSLGSQRYVPNYGAIGISKAALESLVRYLAVELLPQGIRVNAISGGPVETDALMAFPDYERVKEVYVQRTPARRLGKPEDIADIVVFLCSSTSHWISGQTIIADGGLSLVI